MRDVVVVGAGKIGAFVAALLASTGDYQVTLADRSPEVLGNLDRDQGIRIMAADAEDSLKLVDLLNGQFAVLNAAPFRLTNLIAEAARAAGTHYLDLTEDVMSTRRVRELAANANIAFIPQCGLAPGFVSIVAFDMVKGFEVLDSVRQRVGASRGGGNRCNHRRCNRRCHRSTRPATAGRLQILRERLLSTAARRSLARRFSRILRGSC